MYFGGQPRWIWSVPGWSTGWMTGWINIDYTNADPFQILCLLRPAAFQVNRKLSGTHLAVLWRFHKQIKQQWAVLIHDVYRGSASLCVKWAAWSNIKKRCFHCYYFHASQALLRAAFEPQRFVPVGDEQTTQIQSRPLTHNSSRWQFLMDKIENTTQNTYKKALMYAF